jgi:hypothetical protein
MKHVKICFLIEVWGRNCTLLTPRVPPDLASSEPMIHAKVDNINKRE